MPTSDQRLRIALAACLLVLFAVLAAWFHRHATAPWRVTQASFAEATLGRAGTLGGILEVRACDGAVDRCTTCHLGVDRQDIDTLPPPFGSHGPGIAGHDLARIGCSACHGGSPRALDERAHLRPGATQRDPLMAQPHVQASCGRCHVPGSVTGDEQLRRGALVYSGLGCLLCHPVGTAGKGGLDYGPDLAAIGRKSPESLRRSLFEPEADFPGSTMPSFRLALEREPIAATSLLIYLESLPLGRSNACGARDNGAALAAGSCTTCHAGAAGAANGRLVHRCLFILDRAEELRCAACHKGEVPQGSKDCPVIASHRSGCPLCHDAP